MTQSQFQEGYQVQGGYLSNTNSIREFIALAQSLWLLLMSTGEHTGHIIERQKSALPSVLRPTQWGQQCPTESV